MTDISKEELEFNPRHLVRELYRLLNCGIKAEGTKWTMDDVIENFHLVDPTCGMNKEALRKRLGILKSLHIIYEHPTNGVWVSHRYLKRYGSIEHEKTEKKEEKMGFKKNDKVLLKPFMIPGVVGGELSVMPGKEKRYRVFFGGPNGEKIMRDLNEADLVGAERKATEKPEIKFHAGEKVVGSTKDNKNLVGTVLSIPPADDPASKYLVRFVLPSANPESPAYMDTQVPQSGLRSMDEAWPNLWMKGTGAIPEKGKTVRADEWRLQNGFDASKTEEKPRVSYFKKGDRVGFHSDSNYRGYSGTVDSVSWSETAQVHFVTINLDGIKGPKQTTERETRLYALPEKKEEAQEDWSNPVENLFNFVQEGIPGLKIAEDLAKAVNPFIAMAESLINAAKKK